MMHPVQLAMDARALSLLAEKQQLLREFDALELSRLSVADCATVHKQKQLLIAALIDELQADSVAEMEARLTQQALHEQLCRQLRDVCARYQLLRQRLRSLSASTLSTDTLASSSLADSLQDGANGRSSLHLTGSRFVDNAFTLVVYSH